MNTLIGRKVGMTRLFMEDGTSLPVTVIEAGPCPVVQVKSEETDGYNAVQLGFGEVREPLMNKPRYGHFVRHGIKPRRYLREVRLESVDGVEVGQEIKVDIFRVGEFLDVTGTSKGLGFQGAVRRHNFAGGPKTHGQSDRLRAPGSIGSSSYPSRVFKGIRMAGRTGGQTITVKNLEVVNCVRGAVPGKPESLLRLRKSR